jgi:hypothetical protein
MGLEPTTFCLGSKRSTTELHPLECKMDYIKAGGNVKQTSHSVIFDAIDKSSSPIDNFVILRPNFKDVLP